MEICHCFLLVCVFFWMLACVQERESWWQMQQVIPETRWCLVFCVFQIRWAIFLFNTGLDTSADTNEIGCKVALQLGITA